MQIKNRWKDCHKRNAICKINLTSPLGTLKVVIEKAHELYLDGSQLDFLKGLENRGFVFNNPNAEETCGCGSSFSV